MTVQSQSRFRAAAWDFDGCVAFAAVVVLAVRTVLASFTSGGHGDAAVVIVGDRNMTAPVVSIAIALISFLHLL